MTAVNANPTAGAILFLIQRFYCWMRTVGSGSVAYARREADVNDRSECQSNSRSHFISPCFYAWSSLLLFCIELMFLCSILRGAKQNERDYHGCALRTSL